MENTDDNYNELYPPKPVFDAPKSSLQQSAISMLLFIVVYYFAFGRDLQSVLILVLVVFIHEMGHFAAMKYYGYSDVKMFFVPLVGAFVSGGKHNTTQRQESVTLLAGPVPGILIGMGLYLLSYNLHSPLLRSAANTFVFLNAFNLLPLMPLDGGRLIDTLFANRRETIKLVFTVVSAILLAVVALALDSYFLLILPVLQLLGMVSMRRRRALQQQLDKQGLDYKKPYEELSNRDYWLIRDEIIEQTPAFKNAPHRQLADERTEQSIADTIKSLTFAEPVADLSGWGKLLFVLLWFFFFISPLVFGVVMYLIKDSQ